jgi:hypothetical protein
MEPEGSLLHSKEPATCPYPEPFPLLKLYQRISPGPRLFIVFCNMVIFYGEELLAPRPTPKLEDHPLSASATAYTMYSQLPSISGGRSSIHNLRTRHAVVTGTHLSWWQGPTYHGQATY